MSNLISGLSAGPGGTSNVSGVGNGSSRGSISGISGSVGSSDYTRSSDAVANNYNFAMVNTSRRQYREDLEDMMSYNSLMYNSALAFSERMSNTAIQRQVKDLISAGLNPVLAARLGGASYSLPSAPYLGNPTYQGMPYYDSSISRQESINQTQVENNIRDNLTKMSVVEVQEYNNNIRNILTNMVNRMNVEDRIKADKYLARFDRETSTIIQNMKDKAEWDRIVYHESSETYRNEYRADLDYLAKIYSSGLLSIGSIFSSGIGAIARVGYGF